MKKFDYTVETQKSFTEAVEAIETNTKEKGFRVLAIHDVFQLLNEKGFSIEPLKIIEICNAKYASQILTKEIKIALMLPCPISVYEKSGKTYISALKPNVMSDFYPDADIETNAQEVDDIIVEIVNLSK